MKIVFPLLIEFITDFELLSREDGILCFDAKVEFSANGQSKHIHTEIQIVTIAHFSLTMFCLLNPMVISAGIPENIYFENDKFTYHKNESLVYSDHSDEYGKYIITMRPSGNQCSVEKQAELNQNAKN